MPCGGSSGRRCSAQGKLPSRPRRAPATSAAPARCAACTFPPYVFFSWVFKPVMLKGHAGGVAGMLNSAASRVTLLMQNWAILRGQMKATLL